MLMWLEFCAAMAAMAVLLYLPGFLILKTARQSYLSSLLFAPPITLAIYGVLAIALSKAGVFGSWKTIVLPVVIVLATLAVASYVRRNRYRAGRVGQQTGAMLHLRDSVANWLQLALYVALGLALTAINFLKPIDGPNSYTQLYDNAWHMGIIRKFLTSGDYSTLNSGDIIATQGSKFYPTGWHSLVALTSSLTGLPVPMCINASIALMLAAVYTGSMYALCSRLFANRPALILFVSVTPLMFAAFPWRFLVFGPLYSNLLSFAALPLVMVLGLNMLEATCAAKLRVATVILFVVSVVGIAITQPNAVFTMGLMIAPYMFSQIPAYLDCFRIEKRRKLWTAGAACGLLLAIAAVWVALYKASFMQRTVTWKWPMFESQQQSVIDILFVGFRDAEPQMLLGMFVLVGLVYTLLHRELLWVSCAYLIMCYFYAVSSSTEGRLKNVLTGFWYHDQYRLGASAVLFAVPLAGIGIYVVLKAAAKLFDGVIGDVANVTNRRLLAALAMFAILVVNFFPSYYLSGRLDVTTAFGAITRDVNYWNSRKSPKSYTAKEAAFVNKVKQAIPADALVLNQPYDGSAYAWGADGLNVYYKAWQGNWMGKPTAANTVIRTKLDRIGRNRSVCAVVQETGAEYLLVLDQSDYKKDKAHPKSMVSMYASYLKSDWKGIDSVNDTTAGFTTMLSEGDMRLYKITARCQ